MNMLAFDGQLLFALNVFNDAWPYRMIIRGSTTMTFNNHPRWKEITRTDLIYQLDWNWFWISIDYLIVGFKDQNICVELSLMFGN